MPTIQHLECFNMCQCENHWMFLTRDHSVSKKGNCVYFEGDLRPISSHACGSKHWLFFYKKLGHVRLCLWSQVGRYPSMSVVTKKPDDMSSEVGTSPSVASKPGVFKEISSCVCGDRHVDFFLTLTKMFLCLVAT